MDPTLTYYFPMEDADEADTVIAYRAADLDRELEDPQFAAPCWTAANPLKQQAAVQSMKDEQFLRNIKRRLDDVLYSEDHLSKKTKAQHKSPEGTHSPAMPLVPVPNVQLSMSAFPPSGMGGFQGYRTSMMHPPGLPRTSPVRQTPRTNEGAVSQRPRQLKPSPVINLPSTQLPPAPTPCSRSHPANPLHLAPRAAQMEQKQSSNLDPLRGQSQANNHNQQQSQSQTSTSKSAQPFVRPTSSTLPTKSPSLGAKVPTSRVNTFTQSTEPCISKSTFASPQKCQWPPTAISQPALPYSHASHTQDSQYSILGESQPSQGVGMDLRQFQQQQPIPVSQSVQPPQSSPRVSTTCAVQSPALRSGQLQQVSQFQSPNSDQGQPQLRLPQKQLPTPVSRAGQLSQPARCVSPVQGNQSPVFGIAQPQQVLHLQPPNEYRDQPPRGQSQQQLAAQESRAAQLPQSKLPAPSMQGSQTEGKGTAQYLQSSRSQTPDLNRGQLSRDLSMSFEQPHHPHSIDFEACRGQSSSPNNLAREELEYYADLQRRQDELEQKYAEMIALRREYEQKKNASASLRTPPQQQATRPRHLNPTTPSRSHHSRSAASEPGSASGSGSSPGSASRGLRHSYNSHCESPLRNETSVALLRSQQSQQQASPSRSDSSPKPNTSLADNMLQYRFTQDSLQSGQQLSNAMVASSQGIFSAPTAHTLIATQSQPTNSQAATSHPQGAGPITSSAFQSQESHSKSVRKAASHTKIAGSSTPSASQSQGCQASGKRPRSLAKGQYASVQPTPHIVALTDAIKALPTFDARLGRRLPTRAALRVFVFEGNQYFNKSSGFMLRHGGFKEWVGNPGLFNDMTWQYLTHWDKATKEWYGVY